MFSAHNDVNLQANVMIFSARFSGHIFCKSLKAMDLCPDGTLVIDDV